MSINIENKAQSRKIKSGMLICLATYSCDKVLLLNRDSKEKSWKCFISWRDGHNAKTHIRENLKENIIKDLMEDNIVLYL